MKEYLIELKIIYARSRGYHLDRYSFTIKGPPSGAEQWAIKHLFG